MRARNIVSKIIAKILVWTLWIVLPFNPKKRTIVFNNMVEKMQTWTTYFKEQNEARDSNRDN